MNRTDVKDFDINSFDVKTFDRILKQGLSAGLGKRGSQVCIEAAICQTLGLPHSDDPGCVAESVRLFKISLNDSSWSNSKARANGLRDLGLAQLGSKGIVLDTEFATELSKKTIKVLIPKLFREIFVSSQKCLEAAMICELEGTAASAYSAASAARSAAYSAACSAASAKRDEYLTLSANLSLEVLKELKSPGIALLG